MKRHSSTSRDSLKCEVCWEKEATFSCRICERRVCEEDFNKGRHICKICEMSMCNLCRENLAIGYCECCGRLICIECTAFHDKSRRICKECYAKNRGRTGRTTRNAKEYE